MAELDGPSLDKLQREIDETKARAGIGKTTNSGNSDGSAMGTAMAYSTELFAGILVGGVMGYFADRWLDTSPVLLILFFFLGAGAGFRNILRHAGKVENEKE